MDLRDELESRVLCGDGAMGTVLINDGVPIDQCLEELCVSQPARIRTIHEQYIAAGSRVIETNTFGANAVRLSRFGLEARVGEINRAAVRVARQTSGGKDVYVAGSVGPLGVGAAEAVARGIDRAACFTEQLVALLDAGVDAIFFETFMDLEEMEVALRAKKALSDLPEICSFACAPDGILPSGVSLGQAFAALRRIGAAVMGINCMNDPDGMARLRQNIPTEFPLAVYPTAGQPRADGARLIYDTTPEAFGEFAREFASGRPRLLGGCCGTTPAHIAAVAAAIR
ncbi:MAG TPA: homocysteine S-methyltransferase family protein [Chthoniobacterales bacterium]|nr:homocysteine S-methyltransferase family protein [Chthoniobacterales bacterium]